VSSDGAPTTGLRQVIRAMGTAVVIDIRDPAALDLGATEAIDAAVADLRWVDATFSTFRADSEISRLGRGELGLAEAHPSVRMVLDRCQQVTRATEGAFTLRGRGGPGAPPLDPSGFVKGWAADRVAAILRAHGSRRFAVNAGGDVLVAGGSPDRPWRIGIRHPDDPRGVAAILRLDDGAVATSGTYERGDHILRRAPDVGATDRTRPADADRVAGALRSATVVGPELGLADALATATFAASGTTPWWPSCPGYEVALIEVDRLRWTAGLDRILDIGEPSPRGAGPSREIHRNL
jgi:thiamine biosynthesis lipoprotein